MKKRESYLYILLFGLFILIYPFLKLADYIKYKTYDVEMESFEIAKPSYYKVCMNKTLDKREVLFVEVRLKNGETTKVNRSLNGSKCKTLLLDSNSRAYINDKVNYERNKKMKTEDIDYVKWQVKILKENRVLDEGLFEMN